MLRWPRHLKTSSVSEISGDRGDLRRAGDRGRWPRQMMGPC